MLESFAPFLPSFLTKIPFVRKSSFRKLVKREGLIADEKRPELTITRWDQGMGISGYFDDFKGIAFYEIDAIFSDSATRMLLARLRIC